MLGMGNNMHLWPEKQAWDTTPNRKERNGWSSITTGTSSKGMGVLKCGSMHDKKLCMHACMYEDKGHKGHVPCEKGPKATPQKQVKHGTLPP